MQFRITALDLKLFDAQSAATLAARGMDLQAIELFAISAINEFTDPGDCRSIRVEALSDSVAILDCFCAH